MKKDVLAILLIVSLIMVGLFLLQQRRLNCLEILGGQDKSFGKDSYIRFAGIVKNVCSRTILNPQLRVFEYIADGANTHLLDNHRIFKVADKIAPNSSIKYDFKFSADAQNLEHHYELQFDTQQ